MLISSNISVDNSDFEKLLNLTVNTLNQESVKLSEKYLKLLGTKLENEVYDVMCENARNTIFEGTIELISGQKFPDIIANNFYGVEVKSTKQNHWKTTGNSVLESTRIEDVQRIFMLFGKIYKPISFKCRPYQECLSDVVVTHSPRYTIDMNLDKGKTIFDKILIDYEDLRKCNNPIKPFKDYYRNKLSEGQELWWLDNEEYKPDSIIFRVWNSLSKIEKKKIKIESYIYFPEILGKQQNKFDKLTLWLSVKKRIVCPNVRDLFSAGGRQDIILEGVTLKAVPKTIIKLIQNIEFIISGLCSVSIDDINESWRTKFNDRQNIEKQWVKIITKYCLSIYNFGDFNIEKWLENKILEFK